MYLFRQRWGRDPLNRTALLLLLSGLLAMGVELVVDLYLGSVQFQWALYVLISCWVLPRRRGWWPDGRKFGRKLQNASFINGFLGHLGKIFPPIGKVHRISFFKGQFVV